MDIMAKTLLPDKKVIEKSGRKKIVKKEENAKI